MSRATNVRAASGARAERAIQRCATVGELLMFEITMQSRICPVPHWLESYSSNALEYLDKLAQEAKDDPSLQRELAGAYEGRRRTETDFARQPRRHFGRREAMVRH